jgi:hypothetical protein
MFIIQWIAVNKLNFYRCLAVPGTGGLKTISQKKNPGARPDFPARHDVFPFYFLVNINSIEVSGQVNFVYYSLYHLPQKLDPFFFFF